MVIIYTIENGAGSAIFWQNNFSCKQNMLYPDVWFELMVASVKFIYVLPKPFILQTIKLNFLKLQIVLILFWHENGIIGNDSLLVL